MLKEVSNIFSYMAMSSHLETLTFPSLVFKPHAPSSASITAHTRPGNTRDHTRFMVFFFKPLESDGIVSDSLAGLKARVTV